MTDKIAHLVGGWRHADGTLCPEYLAPERDEGQAQTLWCTTHQQSVTGRGPTPPAFPTVTIPTADGPVVVLCEPVGEQLAIVPEFGMTPAPEYMAALLGTFTVVARGSGRTVTTSGGCIGCARNAARVLAAIGIDWTRSEPEIVEQAAGLSLETRRELAVVIDLAFRCDITWCDDSGGPGIVFVDLDSATAADQEQPANPTP